MQPPAHEISIQKTGRKPQPKRECILTANNCRLAFRRPAANRSARREDNRSVRRQISIQKTGRKPQPLARCGQR